MENISGTKNQNAEKPIEEKPIEEKKTIKLARETATAEYDYWARIWKVGRNMRHAKGKDIASFEQNREEIISLIEDGFLSYDDSDNTMNYIFQFPEDASGHTKLTLKKPHGDALAAGDKFEEGEHVKKAQIFLERMSGQPPVFFGKLDFVDLQDLYKIMNHFLGS